MTCLRRWLVGALCVSTVCGLALGLALRRWPAEAVVVTGQTPSAPALAPLALEVSVERARAAIDEAIEADEGWTLRPDWQAEGSGTFGGAAARGAQSFEVRVEPNGPGGAVVHVRAPHEGVGADWGARVRAIERLFDDTRRVLARGATTLGSAPGAPRSSTPATPENH